MWSSKDDKKKNRISEPGHSVDPEVRQKQVVTIVGTLNQAEDHSTDSVEKIVPSVFLDHDIPADAGDSWFQGQLKVNNHSMTLDPSTLERQLYLLYE